MNQLNVERITVSNVVKYRVMYGEYALATFLNESMAEHFLESALFNKMVENIDQGKV